MSRMSPARNTCLEPSLVPISTFAGKMNDQPAFGKRVEVPLSGTVKLLHPDLVYIGQCAQFRVLLQTQFLDMAFTVAPRKNSIDSHSAPPQSLARLLRSGLRLVRQTISSAQHSLAGHNEGIVASGRRIVHRYSSGKSRVASGRGYVDCKLRRLSPKCTMLEKEKCPKRLQCSDGLERRILGTWVVP